MVIEINENIRAYIKDNLYKLRNIVSENGFVYIRGSNLTNIMSLDDIACEFSGKNTVKYSYSSSPRTKLLGNVYTSTEYPKELMIQLHNENSYTDNYPSFILFYCLIPADKGGETPIADSSMVYQQIDPYVRDEFESKRVMYTRNYTDTFDLSWQSSFSTQNKDHVVKYCNQHNIDFQWLNDSNLKTRQVCEASKVYKGKRVWFNQAHLFSQYNNDKIFRDYYKDLSPLDYPRNSFFGDGSVIPEEYILHIQEIYKNNAILNTWNKGELLILDNVAFSHGRMPFEGKRRILVCMS